jgi:hypothetical protein
MSGSLSTEGFSNTMCTLASRIPARLVRHFFSRLDTPRILSCLRVGHVYEGSCCGDEGTDGSELALGIGAGGGQPGSSARARRSLAVNQPCGTRVSHGGEARSYGGRWRVAAGGAARFGGGGPRDYPPPEMPGTEGFRIKYFRTQHLLRRGDTMSTAQSLCSTSPSLSLYPPIGRLPQAICLGLSQRQVTRISGPITT